MDDLIKSSIKKYRDNRKKEYVFCLSKKKKKTIQKESIILQFPIECWSHLFGIHKLKDLTIKTARTNLFNKLWLDIQNNKIEQNPDFNKIKNSKYIVEIKTRIELLNNLNNLIKKPNIKIYQYNPAAKKVFYSKIKYDYIIQFYNDEDNSKQKYWYLFCVKNNSSSFMIEPVSLFKTDKSYHNGDLIWNIEKFYITEKIYENKYNYLYPKVKF